MELPVERTLAAILSADVNGYSRLMADDDIATVETLTAYRDVIARAVERFRGRVIEAPGDNVLAEFFSAVDAVESAVAIQRDLETRNSTLPQNRRMEFRIRITVGDVIVKDGRLYGDGVNVAARIEGLAAAGGVAVSANVWEQVKNKVDLTFKPAGEHVVKNIPDAVRVRLRVQRQDLESSRCEPAARRTIRSRGQCPARERPRPCDGSTCRRHDRTSQVG